MSHVHADPESRIAELIARLEAAERQAQHWKREYQTVAEQLERETHHRSEELRALSEKFGVR